MRGHWGLADGTTPVRSRRACECASAEREPFPGVNRHERPPTWRRPTDFSQQRADSRPRTIPWHPCVAKAFRRAARSRRWWSLRTTRTGGHIRLVPRGSGRNLGLVSAARAKGFPTVHFALCGGPPYPKIRTPGAIGNPHARTLRGPKGRRRSAPKGRCRPRLNNECATLARGALRSAEGRGWDRNRFARFHGHGSRRADSYAFDGRAARRGFVREKSDAAGTQAIDCDSWSSSWNAPWVGFVTPSRTREVPLTARTGRQAPPAGQSQERHPERKARTANLESD